MQEGVWIWMSSARYEGARLWKILRSRILNAGFDGEQMELLQGRSDVFSRGSSGEDTSSRFLDQLEFIE